MIISIISFIIGVLIGFVALFIYVREGVKLLLKNEPYVLDIRRFIVDRIKRNFLIK